ncbi:thap4 protein [Holotrichia oblita]|uniref:Thap4 protein n=1 Tax=Holotrichia oblita TaxID=644536 RepID=A0ACB9TIL5_HOLOL|nr:thap4 protein [Holotrichia oblita]
METGSLHNALKPLSFLIGKWTSTNGKGSYPTIQPFEFGTDLEFSFIGQPMLNYKWISWHPTKRTPMHQESGFLRIKPGTCELALLVAHNFGITTLEMGTVEGKSIALYCDKSQINRIPFAKEPHVTGLKRTITYDEETQQLEMLISMATTNTPDLTHHLAMTFKKL